MPYQAMPSSSRCSQCHRFLLVSANSCFKKREREKRKITYKMYILSQAHVQHVSKQETANRTFLSPSIAISLDCLLKLPSQIATVSVVLVTFGNSISVFWGYIDFLWLSCSNLASY